MLKHNTIVVFNSNTTQYYYPDYISFFTGFIAKTMAFCTRMIRSRLESRQNVVPIWPEWHFSTATKHRSLLL